MISTRISVILYKERGQPQAPSHHTELHAQKGGMIDMLMTKIRPQRPDTPDIDDLIYGTESAQSTK